MIFIFNAPIILTLLNRKVFYFIERLHKQLHYVRLIGMCGKCPIATIQIISVFDDTATTDGQTAKPLQYGNRLS